jgi:acyl carrier protein
VRTEDTLTIVRQVLGRYTQAPRLVSADPAEVSLHDLAIPSVDMIGIVIELEDRFGRIIDESRMHVLRTVADLVRALEQR